MYKPDNDQQPENSGTHQRSVLAMSGLSAKQERHLSHSDITGTPEQFIRPILDADLRRFRTRNFRNLDPEALDAQIYCEFAKAGIEGEDWQSTALLWSARIWRYLRTTSLSCPGLESPGDIPSRARLYKTLSPAATSYRILAARACRLSAPHAKISPLRRQICDQIQRGQRVRYYPLLSAEAETWFSWASTACAQDVQGSNAEAYPETRIPGRKWKEVAITLQYARRLQPVVLEQKYGPCY